jgi:hypothetical protein
MKTDLIFLLVIAVYIGYYLCKKESFTENFGEVEDEAARKAVRAIYNADIESIKTLSDIAKKLQAGGLTHPGDLRVRGTHFATGDMVMNGGNNWLFHTPDDNRRTMYVAPSGTYNQENWNWGASTEFNPDGSIFMKNYLNAPSLRRVGGDWLRINDGGVGRTALYGNLSINDAPDGNSGLAVGSWTDKVGQGSIAATGNISANGNLIAKGRTSFGGDMSEGIVNIRNRNGSYTHFNWPDGQNYIRGNTIVDGALVVNGRNILAELDAIKSQYLKKGERFKLFMSNGIRVGERNGQLRSFEGRNDEWGHYYLVN